MDYKNLKQYQDAVQARDWETCNLIAEEHANKIKNAEKGLSSILWLTHNQKFNAEQWVTIGDALASFEDLIKYVKGEK